MLSVSLATDTGMISTSAAMCPMAVFSIVMLLDIAPEEMPMSRKEKNILIIMSDLDAVYYTEDDILLCGRNAPLAYLYSGMNCGTMSTYLTEMDYERLKEYYTLHPDKFPTVVYYYHWINSPDTTGTADGFLEYIKSVYETYEIDGSFFAIAVEGKSIE